ncbi:hypothetical protein CHARACLAT_018414 [Characodon lateralis]|uniref:Uncharacterized protein n=1 Tax=Characodon lateralis TaxID=208331 RepID=A0ABU7EK71_9TELE|nr:hypothetical protein [Characodon lateralis]
MSGRERGRLSPRGEEEEEEEEEEDKPRRQTRRQATDREEREEPPCVEEICSSVFSCFWTRNCLDVTHRCGRDSARAHTRKVARVHAQVRRRNLGVSTGNSLTPPFVLTCRRACTVWAERVHASVRTDFGVYFRL